MKKPFQKKYNTKSINDVSGQKLKHIESNWFRKIR
jgi:hypothetical protein